MYCFFLRLTEDKTYKAAADRLLCALDNSRIVCRLLESTHDIRMRDFMPAKQDPETMYHFDIHRAVCGIFRTFAPIFKARSRRDCRFCISLIRISLFGSTAVTL